MWGLCSLRLLTVWNTSRMPSAFTLSRTVLSAQKVPVRPAPALYETNAEGEREARVNQSNTWRWWCHNMPSSFCFMWGSSTLRDLTCSAPWWGGFLTAAAVSALLRLNWSCLCRRWGCPPLASHGNGTGAQLGLCSPKKRGERQKDQMNVRCMKNSKYWFLCFLTSYPVIGDQEVTHRVTLILLLLFYLNRDVAIDHCPVTGPILGTFFLQEMDIVRLLLLEKRDYWRSPHFLAFWACTHPLTCPLSSSSVSMTMEQLLHSQIILQKSSMVCCRGPWLAM